MDRDILREIGEWAALGFYEAADEPWPRSYGRAYRRMYENLPVCVPTDRCLIPCEPMADSRTRESHGVWTATSLICDHNHNCGLQVQISAVNREEMLAAQTAPEKHADLIVRIGGYSEYFVVLPKDLQDSVLARTEHGLE